MNLTLLTHYIPTPKENYQIIADLTIPAKEAYCQRFGYRHMVHCGSYGNERLYWAIQRLQLVYDYLFSAVNDVDFVWILNPQTVLTNLALPVTQYLDNEHDFYICADINGLNASSCVFRKSEWTKRWIEHIISHTKTHTHCWHEQFSIIQSYQLPEWKDKIKVLDHPSILSYRYSMYGRGPETPGDWRKGHLTLALPGTTFADRVRIIPEVMAGNNIVY